MAAALDDFRGWPDATRMAMVATGWVVAVVAVGLIGSPGLTSTAARAVYLLPAVYAVQLLANETGQPSLGHAAFVALGAYATAGLRLHAGLDGALAAAVSTILGGAVGWGLGWGATRLAPPILALLTWTFGWLVYIALGAFPGVTGGVAGVSLHAPMRVRWDLLGVDITLTDFGHVVLGSVLLAFLLLLYRSAQQSAIGRAWAALRDSRTLASSLGHDVPAIRRWTFAVAAAVAALAGSLGAQLLQVVDPTLYSPLQSLNLFVAVLIGAPLGFFGPVVGALVTSGAPVAVDNLSQLTGLPLGTGRQLLVAALTVAALWFSAWIVRRRANLVRALAAAPGGDTRPTEAGPDEPRAQPTAAADALLQATGVTLDFEGLRALDSVAITVPAGAIHGLVGPNGSGKTTLLRVLSGTFAPRAGTVHLDGVAMHALDEPGHVRAGIVRTFQRTAVMPGLRVREHVEVGLNVRQGHASPLQAILKSPANRAEAAAGRRIATQLLQTFGLGGLEEAYPETLSGGRQRLLQMATAVATAPRVLLLDEPSTGMSPDEVVLLHRALTTVAAGGIGILLIEHNMRFLAGVASHVTVLDGGRVLAAGTPAEVAANSDVRRAYLGVSVAPTPTRRSPGRKRRQ